MITKYLPPTNGIVFEKIFGEIKHWYILKSFLNAVLHLKGEDALVDLEYLGPKDPYLTRYSRECIVEVVAKNLKGMSFVIQIELLKIEEYYPIAKKAASKVYSKHAIKKTPQEFTRIFLVVADCVVFPKKQAWKTSCKMPCELEETGAQTAPSDFDCIVIELPKFNKAAEELESAEDRWCYFLKHADKSNNMNEIVVQIPEIKEAYEIAEYFQWTEGEHYLYEKRVMVTRDQRSQMDYEWEEGRKEGFKKGQEESRRNILGRMLNLGWSFEEIESCLKITQEEYLRLKEEISGKTGAR